MAVTARELPVPTKTTRKLTFIERLAPKWGRETAWWIVDEAAESGAWFAASLVMTIIVTGIGLALLFGDGYATIQGVRYFLRLLGLERIRTDDFPAAPWWIIQVVLVIIQVFGKVMPGLRPLWRPSYILNAITTGVFVGIATANLLNVSLGVAEGIRPTDATIVCGIVGAVIGHLLAVGAEQVTLTGLCMAGALFTALFRR